MTNYTINLVKTVEEKFTNTQNNIKKIIKNRKEKDYTKAINSLQKVKSTIDGLPFVINDMKKNISNINDVSYIIILEDMYNLWGKKYKELNNIMVKIEKDIYNNEY